MQFNKKVAAALGAGALAVAGSGVAFAYWTATGSGSGSAAAGSITDGIQVHQTSTVSGLYPGSTPQELSGDFGNTNDSPAYVTSVTVSLASVSHAQESDEAHPACTLDDFVLSASGTATDNGNGTITMPVGQEIAGQAGQDTNDFDGSWGGAKVQLQDLETNQDTCKGASINLSYTSD